MLDKVRKILARSYWKGFNRAIMQTLLPLQGALLGAPPKKQFVWVRAKQCVKVPLNPDLLKLASTASAAVRDNAICQTAMLASAAPVEGASSSSSKDDAAKTLVQEPAKSKRFHSLTRLFEENKLIDKVV